MILVESQVLIQDLRYLNYLFPHHFLARLVYPQVLLLLLWLLLHHLPPPDAKEWLGPAIRVNPSMHDTRPTDNFLIAYFGFLSEFFIISSLRKHFHYQYTLYIINFNRLYFQVFFAEEKTPQKGCSLFKL